VAPRGPVCLGATLTGALTPAAVVWPQPVDRMRARLVRDATIFTGLDTMTIPLLQRLAQTFRPASIVVIEPDASTGGLFSRTAPAAPASRPDGDQKSLTSAAVAAGFPAEGNCPW
jgi:hypothetical protein